MKITGNEPATGFGYANESSNAEYEGLTIRQQLSMFAMQGLLANTEIIGAHASEDISWISKHSIHQADDLIKAWNEMSNPNI